MSGGAVIETTPGLIYLRVGGWPIQRSNTTRWEIFGWDESGHKPLHFFCVGVFGVVCSRLELTKAQPPMERVAGPAYLTCDCGDLTRGRRV